MSAKRYASLHEAFITESLFGIHTSTKMTYIGKTDNLKKIEQLLDQMIAKDLNHNDLVPMISSKRAKFVSQSLADRKEVKQICELLKKEFGFKEVSISIAPLAIVNAMTLMQSFIIRDITTGMPSLLRSDDNGKFYDSKHQYILSLVFFSELFTGRFTAEELMFLLLHEIGHNFDVSLASYIPDLFFYFMDIPNMFKQPGKLMDKIISGFSVVLYLFGGNVSKPLLDNFPSLNKKLPKLFEIFNRGFAMQNYYNKLYGPLFILLGVAQKVAEGAIKLSPLNIFLTTAGFQKERFSDSFAVIYGYGPAAITASQKFDDLFHTTGDQGKGLEGFDNFSFVNSQLFSIIAMVIDPHPENQTRARMCLDDMKTLVEKGDFNPKVKAALKKNYEMSKRNYDNFIKVNNKENSAELLKMSRQFKETYLFGKMDLRSYIMTGSAIYGP